MCSGSEAGLYLRRIDSCITQHKAQGPSRTCNESKEEDLLASADVAAAFLHHAPADEVEDRLERANLAEL